jgi:hypothetical protein
MTVPTRTPTPARRPRLHRDGRARLSSLIASACLSRIRLHDGKAALDPVRSYALGSVTYVAARNLFVVRLATGDFYALADLDAANRASASRRCRVGPVAATDPALPGLLEKLGSRLSPEAAGSTLVFREDCFGAVYDVTGLRLDADEGNLDRYPVVLDGKGNVVVNTAKRQCSRRDAAALFATIGCK